jgi:26S proteasome regulatory subunit N5
MLLAALSSAVALKTALFYQARQGVMPFVLRRYLVLCPAYSTKEGSASDYMTLCNNVLQDPLIDDLPDHKDLLNIFLTQEVAGVQALKTRYGQEIAAQEDIFGGTEGQKRQEDFMTRVTEHNLMVISKYYSRLSLDRLSMLLNLPVDDAEEHLANLVINDAIKAKIDRPAGIVHFTPAQGPVQILDHWAESISKLLGLVETTCQKIQKESMQHNVPIPGA